VSRVITTNPTAGVLGPVNITTGFDADGQQVTLSFDADGNLLTKSSGGASGGTSAVDESAFSLGSDSLTPGGGVYNDAAPALSSGEVGTQRVTAYRASHVNLRKNDGTELGIVTAPLRVDPTGTTAQPVELQDGSGNPISSTGGALNVAGSLTVTPTTSSTATAPSQLSVTTSAQTVLASNASRKRFTLQNCGQTVIYVAFGGTNPTSSNYHFALPACGADNDGSSPQYQDVMWTGAVRVIGSASGGLLQVVELT
jgi:hypothetical protein